MKVLIPNLSFYHFRNVAACLQTVTHSSGAEVFLWNVDQKSMIDAFDDSSPDLVFLHENQVDDAFNMLCNEMDFEYVLVGSRQNSNLPRPPSMMITSETFKKNFTNTEKVISLKPAAKVTDVHSAKSNDRLQSEVLVLTGVVPHTPPVVDAMKSLSKAFRTKIVGDLRVDSPSYLGKVNMFQRADLIKSTQVLVDFGSYDYLDAAYLQTAAVFGQPPLAGMEAVRTFSDIRSLVMEDKSLLNSDEQRKNYASVIHEDTIKNHTYYHRTAEIFETLGMKDIANDLLDFFRGLLK